MNFREAYSQLLEGINRNVQLTRDDIKMIVDYLMAPRNADNPKWLTLASSELKEEDFIHIKFWRQCTWQAIKNKTLTLDSDLTSPIISLYMEDELGRPIPSGIKYALRKDLYSYWNDLYWAGSSELHNHGALGMERRQHFSQTFEGKFPWLRLCEGHWKVDQLWVGYFSTWKRPRSTPDTQATEESSPISISAIMATSPPPVTSKRGLEEDKSLSEVASKRHKGYGSDLMAPTIFHNSRPLPRKVPAKLAKVRLTFILFIIQHTDEIQDRL
jgi:hypothetical protein